MCDSVCKRGCVCLCAGDCVLASSLSILMFIKTLSVGPPPPPPRRYYDGDDSTGMLLLIRKTPLILLSRRDDRYTVLEWPELLKKSEQKKHKTALLVCKMLI